MRNHVKFVGLQLSSPVGNAKMKLCKILTKGFCGILQNSFCMCETEDNYNFSSNRVFIIKMTREIVFTQCF